MELVVPAPVSLPGQVGETHALVIGVGAYPHLVGGSGVTFAGHEGMGQLTSPPFSAEAFARWLLSTYHNPQKPLASVQLLISADPPHTFHYPGGSTAVVDAATMANVKPAIKRWIARGDQIADNLMLFFFSGHGIAAGAETSLLLEDFGAWPANPLENAIDFRNFHLGMDKCRARQQCYFIDTCRVASATLIETFDYAGDPIVPGTTLGARDAPIYYATVAGSRAYGRPNRPSVFTEALLDALAGAGADDPEGDWRVYSDQLNRGISQLVTRAVGAGGTVSQAPTSSWVTPFPLHFLRDRPVVPVDVTCHPADANTAAQLSYADAAGNPVVRHPAEASNWEVSLPEGRYDFTARFPPGTPYRDATAHRAVRPVYRLVRIEVDDD